MEEKTVGIICSADDNATDYHKSIARSVASYLAGRGFNLVYGGGSTSLMGICYDEFKKNNRKIEALTTEKYKEEFLKLDADKEIICETTFDLKKEIFSKSDIVVVLPGGIGTYSEILSFIEEKRSNLKEKPIEIYDEDGYYIPLIDLIKIIEVKGVVDGSVYDNFKVSHNKDELIEHIDEYMYKGKGVK